MTTSDASAAQAGASVPAAMARFAGHGKAFWVLLARGAVLLMFTLGIYRFWLTTDIRRYLWSNTQIADETFEYTGTARELLLGFLIAIAVLIPLYTAFFLLTLAPGEGIWTLLSIVVLGFLGQYAVYRARRYRLTRTIYRGVRFNQTGSPWRYSVCAVLWWILIALTLGLAYPFAQSQLEHFKMRNTFFGNLPGRFEASGWRLFVRGLLLWALAVLPFLVGVVATIVAIDWKAVTSATGGDDKIQLVGQQRTWRGGGVRRLERRLAPVCVRDPLPCFPEPWCCAGGYRDCVSEMSQSARACARARYLRSTPGSSVMPPYSVWLRLFS